MDIGIKPPRGGFLRPFGCGTFIRDYLMGDGPTYWEMIPTVDPDVGGPQAEIFYWYKRALLYAFAENQVAREEEERVARGIPAYTIEEADERVRWYMARIPIKLTRARYHSFVIYFSNLQRLGWVEEAGIEEPSIFQERYPGAQPRKFFRLTDAGREAPDTQWSNPLFTIYGEKWGREYLRELRRRHKYLRRK